MRIDTDISPDYLVQLAYYDYYKSVSNVTGVHQAKPLSEEEKRQIERARYTLMDILHAVDFSKNKMMILQLLKRSDLIEILYLLEKKQLLNGLFQFDKAKLLRMIFWLPKPVLIKMLMHVMPLEQFVKMLPPQELLAILRDRKIQVRELVKAFRKMDLKFLQFMLTKITGEDTSQMSEEQILPRLASCNKRQLMEGVVKLPYKAMMQLVYGFAKQDPTLLENVSTYFLGKVFDRMDKRTLVDMCEVLPEHILIDMLAQLPDQYLMDVAAQIDDKPFSEYLISRQSSLLYNLAAAEAA